MSSIPFQLRAGIFLNRQAMEAAEAADTGPSIATHEARVAAAVARNPVPAESSIPSSRRVFSCCASVTALISRIFSAIYSFFSREVPVDPASTPFAQAGAAQQLGILGQPVIQTRVSVTFPDLKEGESLIIRGKGIELNDWHTDMPLTPVAGESGKYSIKLITGMLDEYKIVLITADKQVHWLKGSNCEMKFQKAQALTLIRSDFEGF